jgi:hypothetical protein
MPEDRTDVDDLAAPLAFENRQHALAKEEHILQVVVDHCIERFFGRAAQRRQEITAGIVDEDVHGPVGVDDPGHCGIEIADAADVCLHRQRLAASRRMESTTTSAFLGSRPMIATLAPSAAKRRANAAPIPCDPPVTMATRPLSLTQLPLSGANEPRESRQHASSWRRGIAA